MSAASERRATLGSALLFLLSIFRRLLAVCLHAPKLMADRDLAAAGRFYHLCGAHGCRAYFQGKTAPLSLCWPDSDPSCGAFVRFLVCVLSFRRQGRLSHRFRPPSLSVLHSSLLPLHPLLSLYSLPPVQCSLLAAPVFVLISPVSRVATVLIVVCMCVSMETRGLSARHVHQSRQWGHLRALHEQSHHAAH